VSNLGILCRLTRRWVSDQIRTEVTVRIDGSDSDWLVDMFNNPPRLIREDSVDSKNLYGVNRSLTLRGGPPSTGFLSPGSTGARPAQKAGRVSYHQLLTAKVDVSPTEFSSLWNDCRVTVRISPLHPLSAVQSYDAETFVKEADILATSLHPSLIRVRAICMPPPPSTMPTTTPTTTRESNAAMRAPILVAVRDPLEAQPLMNVVGGSTEGASSKQSLQSLRRDKRWTLERMLHVGLQLAEATSELHTFGLTVGADLTSHSLLITPMGDIKVGDFTAARYSLVPPPPPMHIRYRAAELFDESHQTVIPKPTMKSDVYAFGCVMYTIVVGREPWSGKTETDIRNAVVGRRESPTLPADLKIDTRLADVIKRCVKSEPADRLAFEEIAANLKSILDATKKSVPVSQVAPFGFAHIVCLSFFHSHTRILD
jgi:serine/threonine protein kinase